MTGWMSVCIAQERLIPMEFNPVIQQYIKTHGDVSLKLSVLPDTLTLPFMDDFSEAGIYPSVERWTDNKVFINSDLARNMPTVGAATFDGLDEYGNAYVPGSVTGGHADTLTSKPVYLHTNGVVPYTLTDSIYISFFYEKKGYGDAPDASDSLILEFYDPVGLDWTRTWFVKGGVTAGQDTLFTRVDVLITDAAFLADGFQFRFRSYGNVSGNLDHWHIDYVRVFSYTLTGSMELFDVAFSTSRSRYLTTYTSVPWSHYKNSSSTALLPPNTTVNFIHYNNLPQDIGFNHRSYDINGGLVGSFGAPGGNILGPFQPNQRLNYIYPMGYPYTTTPEISTDSNYFDFYDFFSNLGTTNNALRSNDTIHYRQEFYNYYSYDDGTCEVGYDLTNAPNGRVAMWFDILQSDLLRGVQIFFAQQNTVVSNKLMTIKVWSSLSPEIVIFQQTNMYPAYIDSINGFATYVFNQLFTAPTSFYIGIQQIAADGLHLGFDRNTVNNARMYSNVSGVWSQVSAAQGTFMIRPFLGDTVAGVADNAAAIEKLILYPNPANNYFEIANSFEKFGKMNVIISDITGRVVYEKPLIDSRLNISFLKPGVYVVSVHGNNYSTVPERLIVQ